jgi:hypothetical protein
VAIEKFKLQDSMRVLDAVEIGIEEKFDKLHHLMLI